MCEVHTSLKITGHTRMHGEFPDIIVGDGMYPILVGSEPLCDSFTYCLGSLAEDGPYGRMHRFALDQRNQSALAALPDHVITFPVSEAPFGINHCRTIIDRDLVGNVTALVIGAITLALSPLTTQKTIQVAV